MKKYIIVTGVIIAIAAGCTNRENEIANLKHQQDSLEAVISERNTSVNDFLQSYTEIEMSLDAVAKQGNIISENIEGQTELKSTQKERINKSIESINSMMAINRAKLADLTRRIKNSDNKNVKLVKMVEMLNEQMMDKDRELIALNNKLSSLNTQVEQLTFTVDTLQNVNTTQLQTINDQKTAMHTAYYIEGKSKELKEMKVINNMGGVLGVGKTAKLNENIDNSKFTQIDYTQVNQISVNSEDAKIITPHPSDSYSWDKDKDVFTNLRITNPDKFWSESRYLVIVKD